MKKCQKCRGHKTILGMGGIKLKCEECKGLGFLVEAKPVEAIPAVTVTTNHIKPNSKKVKVKEVKVEQPNV